MQTQTKSTYVQACLIMLLLLLGSVGIWQSGNLEAMEGDSAGGSGEPTPAADRSPLVVGGEIVENPPSWIVQLNKEGSPFCTGTLIFPQWVLSAGHCGLYPGEEALIGGTTAYNGGPELIDSSFILSSLGGNSDLALHKLAEPVPYAPLGINKNVDLLTENPWVVAMGYGAQNEDGANDFKLRSTGLLFVYSRDAFQSAFEYGNEDSSVTTCFGDSGGPVLGNTNVPSAEMVVAGVVSYTNEVDGRKCNGQGGAADVAENLAWIESTVADNGGPGVFLPPTQTPEPITQTPTLPAATPTRFPPTATPVPTLLLPTRARLIRGDANCDSSVDSIDALIIMQFTVQMRDNSDDCPLSNSSIQLNVETADFNNDGVTDAVDALQILQCEAGIPNPGCS